MYINEVGAIFFSNLINVFLPLNLLYKFSLMIKRGDESFINKFDKDRFLPSTNFKKFSIFKFTNSKGKVDLKFWPKQ